MLPLEHTSDWKGSVGALVYAYNCTHDSSMGFSPYFLMYSRQHKLPTDVTLGITQKLITIPTSSKYIQKFRNCTRWAHRKANLFQQKKVWYDKQNYERCSKAVSLRMGDMVLVCITAFKDRHKIQIRWEKREYVVEWQQYPNLPVYVVHPIDGEGHSHTLHRNYLLPISNNLEQDKCENSVEGGGPSDEPTPIPHENDALLVDCPTESQPEGIPNSPPKQHKQFEPGLTRSTSTDPAD